MPRTARPAESPTSFRTPEAFRAWLAKNHATVAELIVRCYKVHSADRGITYAQALDEALCHGWIDGVRRSLDADSFSIRFTPRSPKSNWSRVNVAHVARLTKTSRMAQPGLDAFARRTEARTGVYSFERRDELAPAHIKTLRASKAAWEFYQRQAPWYRRTTARWIMSAKLEGTRTKRLAQLIDCSARGEPIPPLDRRRGSSMSPSSIKTRPSAVS
jgi:uncharacterized protein YdeI (YjbR/CyaY-like superfamily)